MKSFFALSVLASLVASSSAKSCSLEAVPKNVTILDHTEPIVPSKHLPAPNPASKSDKIVELFQKLGRTTVWKLVERVQFQGEMGEPEGIVRLGDNRYFVSSGMYTQGTVSFGNGTIINGTDRSPGAGVAHCLVFDASGKRIADAALSSPGAIEYHTGGYDYDGEYIWATIAQYRPNTTAHVLRIDPTTLDAEIVFHVNDHEGGIVHDTKTDEFALLNWGSRNASTWKLDGSRSSRSESSCKSPVTAVSTVRNPSYYVDYQDCKFLGHPAVYDHRGVMICSGVATLTNTTTIGGIAIVDIETMTPLDEVPITMVSDLGMPVTQNPFDVDIVDDKLRVYFMPDLHNSTLYVYEAQPNSPFEF